MRVIQSGYVDVHSTFSSGYSPSRWTLLVGHTSSSLVAHGTVGSSQMPNSDGLMGLIGSMVIWY